MTEKKTSVTEKKEIRINVPALARVEGEGALDLTIRDNEIQALQLRIYEPPRYFEKFLEGRDYTEVPDVVARICGICPVAYQMSALQALESICGYAAPAWLENLRRVMYCGEWIQSHSLHIHMLALPDFLGFNSITQMASKYATEVRRGLMLQGIGNDLIALLGARSVHPVGAKVGGFHRLPSAQDKAKLRERINAALPEAEALLAWTATLNLPDDKQEFVSVALRHNDEYPIYNGRLVSSDGLDISIAEYDEYFAEHHVPHSTALHALFRGKPYLVGPLARLNLNYDRLPQALRNMLQATGIEFPSRNMFHSLVARAAEIWLALYEAGRLLGEDVDSQVSPSPTPAPRAGVGFGCTEAPRGILWHRYEMNERGQITSARIVPPTSQNQPRIEEDLRNALTRFGLDQEPDAIRLHAEMVIRNYDPCISCATHFLKLDLNRDGVEENSTKEKTGRLVVMGIGSKQPGDDVGLELLGLLREDVQLADYDAEHLVFHSSVQPALDWHRYIQLGDRVLVIDALLADVAESRLVVSDGSALLPTASGLSSHALSLRDAQAMSLVPGQDVDSVTVLGVRVGPDGKSPPDASELNQLLVQIREKILASLS